jgi:uncharacterized Tic20 family protein
MSQYGTPLGPPPGWYPDPVSGAPRYWNGAQWGEYWSGPPNWQQPVAVPPSTTPAILAHLGYVIGGILLPLIIYLVTDASDRFTKVQAAEALNFQITVVIVYFGGIILMIGLGIVTYGIALIVLAPALFAAWVVGLVWTIKAAVAVSHREYWLYPVNIRMVHA